MTRAPDAESLLAGDAVSHLPVFLPSVVRRRVYLGFYWLFSSPVRLSNVGKGGRFGTIFVICFESV